MIAQPNIRDSQPEHFNDVQNHILDVLIYFDIFDHPLNLVEIQNNCSRTYTQPELQEGIQSLLDLEHVFVHGGFYSMNEQIKEQLDRRMEKESIAKKFFSKANFYIRVIQSMPFVRAVAISGSMSKGVIHQNGDIDYFIITDENRLWLARTFLIIFKKVILFNARKYFCVNYFVDISNLKIPDENIFTATEINYLIPVYNHSLILKFKNQNQWTKKYYPHFKHPIEIKEQKTIQWIKKVVEQVLDYSIADLLDRFFLKLTLKRWKLKFQDFNPDKFELTMRSQRGISKHHPQDFQSMVLREIKVRKQRIATNLTKLGKNESTL